MKNFLLCCVAVLLYVSGFSQVEIKTIADTARIVKRVAGDAFFDVKGQVSISTLTAGSVNDSIVTWDAVSKKVKRISRISLFNHSHTQYQILGLVDSLNTKVRYIDTAAIFSGYARSQWVRDSLQAVQSRIQTKEPLLGFTPVPNTRTVNGHALSADVTVTKSDVGLGNVPNTDATNASNISSGTLPDARLSANVTTQGNSFNSANQLVKLDGSAKLPTSTIPSLALVDTYVSVSQAAMLALSAEQGDICVRTDIDKSFVLQGAPASTLGNWIELLAPDSETDPVFTASAAFGITSTNISNWNTAYGWGNHASAGYSTASNTQTFTNKTWNGVAITNAYINDVAWGKLTGVPSTFAPSSHTHPYSDLTGTVPTWNQNTSGNAATASAVAWSGITSKPTTISGYGITDYNSLGDARWQPLENQRLSTSNSPAFSGLAINSSYNLTLSGGDIFFNSNAGYGLLSQNTTRVISVTNSGAGIPNITGNVSVAGSGTFGGSLKANGSTISTPFSVNTGANTSICMSEFNSTSVQLSAVNNANNAVRDLILNAPGGRVGINIVPTNKFQIGASSGAAGNDMVIGNGANNYALNVSGGEVYQYSDGSMSFSTGPFYTKALTISASQVITASNRIFSPSLMITDNGTYGEWQFGTDATADGLYIYKTGSVAAAYVLKLNKSTGGATFSSSVLTNSDMYASKFWDVNNTTYYVDPASTSVFNAATFAGTITASGGGFNSDMRIKDVLDYNAKLSIAKMVKMIKYTLKADTTKAIKYGYGAQLIKPYLPEAVYTNEVTGKYAVDYTMVHTVLINELIDRVESLEKKVKKHEKRN